MTDRILFVQFPHPGSEQKPGRDGTVGWNEPCNSHKRKFMKLQGDWIGMEKRHKDEAIYAWGEWEPESKVIQKCASRERNSHAPHYLYEPHWLPRKNYEGLHNTDPCIFGSCFLYSNCRQTSQGGAGLRNLGRGSVIAFGSGQQIEGKREWALDTVLVVKDYIDYDPLNPWEKLKGEVPGDFLDVVIRPLCENLRRDLGCAERCPQLRLYRGATPNSRVNGMYSFFPAKPAAAGSCFSRPLVSLDEKYFNTRSWQAPRGIARTLPDIGDQEMFSLWESLVKQVLCAGLVLGTSACWPPKCGR